MSRHRRHLVVRGVVQGVGFRWSAASQAGRLGVAGWVRNRGDGSVEAVVEGEEAAVEQFVAWARHGPRGASVSALDVVTQQPEGLTSFDVEP